MPVRGIVRWWMEIERWTQSMQEIEAPDLYLRVPDRP
jgi:hypothetical protein